MHSNCLCPGYGNGSWRSIIMLKWFKKGDSLSWSLISTVVVSMSVEWSWAIYWTADLNYHHFWLVAEVYAVLLGQSLCSLDSCVSNHLWGHWNARHLYCLFTSFYTFSILPFSIIVLSNTNDLVTGWSDPTSFTIIFANLIASLWPATHLFLFVIYSVRSKEIFSYTVVLEICGSFLNFFGGQIHFRRITYFY